MLSRMNSAFVVAALLVCWSASAQATLINVDFHTAGHSTEYVQTGAAVWGSAGDVWDTLSPNQFKYLPPIVCPVYALVDSTGAATTATITSLINGVYNGTPTSYASDEYSTGGTAMDLGTANLMTEYVQARSYGSSLNNPVKLEIAGLPANADFSMVVYGGHKYANWSTVFTLSAGNGGDTATTTGATRKISDGVGVAYNFLDGCTDAAGKVTLEFWVASGSSGNQAAFNGFQLDVVPEPSTLVLLATGLIGLLCYAWRKRK